MTSALRRTSGPFLHVYSLIRNASLSRKALFFALLAFAVLSFYRVYSYWVTGFYVSDEFGYAYDAMHGTIYGGRWFFGYFNIGLFRLFQIKSTDSFAIILPFYIFFWASLTVLMLYGTLKTIGYDERTIALSIFSSMFVISFVLLSLGFLTEPVGLAMVMVGIYFVTKFAKFEGAKHFHLLLFSLLSSLAFVAAAGTREPYNIFLILSPILIIIIAISHRKRLPSSMSNLKKWGLILASIALFVGPGTFFLQYPDGFLSSQALPLASAFVQTISHPPVLISPTVSSTTKHVNQSSNSSTIASTSTTETGPPITTTTQTTRIVTITSTMVETISRTEQTQTITITSESGFTSSPPTATSSYSHTNNLTTSTIQTLTTTTAAHTSTSGSPQARSQIVNMLLIFFGGIVLGWGPIMTVLAASGILILFWRSLKVRNRFYAASLVLAIASYASYFFVSYIFSGDPTYFSLSNYSTMLRFSDTAIPACFLTAPLALSYFAKGRIRSAVVVSVLVVFILVAIPAYESYASSNISYSQSNPFGFSYRTAAADIRDYISSHQTGGTYYIIGQPYGWVFTPGVQDLKNVVLYSSIPTPLLPSINQSQFFLDHWTTFYVYSGTSNSDIQSLPLYLRQFVAPAMYPINSTMPYVMENRQVLIQGSGYVFVQIDLAWK